jgi:hypothetical protein
MLKEKDPTQQTETRPIDGENYPRRYNATERRALQFKPSVNRKGSSVRGMLLNLMEGVLV